MLFKFYSDIYTNLFKKWWYLFHICDIHWHNSLIDFDTDRDVILVTRKCESIHVFFS